MKKDSPIIVISLGEYPGSVLCKNFGCVCYDARNFSFGENFQKIISKHVESSSKYCMLVDGDMWPIIPLSIIYGLSKLLLNLFRLDFISYGRLERFLGWGLIAHGGVRVYNIHKIKLRSLEFYSESNRPETSFLIENNLTGLRLRIPVALHEFYLRPSEAYARAVQRRKKSKNQKSLRCFLLANSATEKAYRSGICHGENLGTTFYTTNVGEKVETYNLAFVIRFILIRVFGVKGKRESL